MPKRRLLRRFLLVHRHLFGLLGGGFIAHARSLPPAQRQGLRSPGIRLRAFLAKPFVNKELAGLPFPVQLLRRLELLGPTYVKLGQIMAIREDLLPKAVTDELKNLLDRLPPIPFEQIRAVIETSLGRPMEELFRHVEEQPIGSASIAQVHMAQTQSGEKLVLKVMKPGIRQAITADLKLLGFLGHLLQWLVSQFQPRQIIEEFSNYTIREIDFSFEADNAEIFAANFQDLPDVVFPAIYRNLSSQDVLAMEFLDGIKPGSPASFELGEAERNRVIDLGAASIIRMLYQDGFFHADLHAGNLLILPGDPIRIGFIDLGMVGRFEEATKRKLLYYYYALVSGDVEGATRYLCAMATVGEGGDLQGFRRAVADLSRRFLMRAGQGHFSLAHVILESVGLGGRFKVFFPVEMTLMVKALVTFEGVGRVLDPNLDIPRLSREHVSRVFWNHFHPLPLARDLLRHMPEMIDLVVRLPELLSAGIQQLEKSLDERPRKSPLAGLRSSNLAGFCLLSGVVALVGDGPPVLWITLLAGGVVLAVFGR